MHSFHHGPPYVEKLQPQFVVTNASNQNRLSNRSFYGSLSGDFGTPGGKWTRKENMEICLADTVATLQQPEFGLQQNDAEVTIRVTAVLQICQKCQITAP
jgi:hypothetical protein